MSDRPNPTMTSDELRTAVLYAMGREVHACDKLIRVDVPPGFFQAGADAVSAEMTREDSSLAVGQFRFITDGGWEPVFSVAEMMAAKAGRPSCGLP